ncbi:MAG: FMN-binding protein [Erysipelotrichaceae bacterium]|jgi:electron transport complex protein RnfG|nr:FMN-binding protein [Erysipelotrichaceae bacterium]
MKRALYLAFFLAIVSALAGGALTLANDLTIDRINANKVAADKANLELIYPGAEFLPIEGFDDETGLIQNIYQAGDAGYVYKLAVNGFSGAGSIEFMVAFGTDGKIAGYTVISCSDTKGIGDKVAADSFVKSIVGKDVGASIDTISGSTVSSSAVVGGIDAAVAHYEANLK